MSRTVIKLRIITFVKHETVNIAYDQNITAIHVHLIEILMLD